jgi:Flp pilus assembly secretin CpaC
MMKTVQMKTSRRAAGAALLLTITIAAGAIAAGAAQAGQSVTVEKNHMVRVALRGSAGSVIVGNPDIADVNVVDSHTIYIIGKGFGSSAVTVTDAAGRSLFDGEVVVTGAQRGGVTVYHGLKASSVVCSNVCISADDAASAGVASGAASGGDAPVAAPVAMNAG